MHNTLGIQQFALQLSYSSSDRRWPCSSTVDFTSHGTPVAVAVGSLWFVCSIGCNVNVANHTNHKFPAATPTGVPCEVEVKSTVQQ